MRNLVRLMLSLLISLALLAADEPATPEAPDVPELPPGEPAEPQAVNEAPDEPITAAELGPLLSAEDRIIFVRDGDLWAVSANGSGLRQLTRTPEGEFRPDVSPDGDYLAFERYDDVSAAYSIWRSAPDGTGDRLLVENARDPEWSPDGGLLLFSSNRAGSLDIFFCNRQGEDIIQVTATPDFEYLPTWAPAGDRIAFVRETTEGGQTQSAVVVRDAGGLDEVVYTLPGQSISGLAWGPDGSLAFAARTGTDRREELYLLAPGSTEPRRLPSSGDSELMPCWTPGGEGLMFVQNRNSRLRIMIAPVGGDARLMPGTEPGDTEPTILPGIRRRAPQIYVGGVRSFYLPTPQADVSDVLLPLADLARQLDLTIQPADQQIGLQGRGMTAALDPDAATLNIGPETHPLLPAPVVIGGAVMVPAKSLATLLGVAATWQPELRVLRIGS